MIRRVTISNVVASGVSDAQGIVISGIPGHPIEDLRLSNIHIAYRGAARGQTPNRQPEEKEHAYPEPDMFGRMPSYGLFARHVAGLSLHDADLTFDAGEYRPAIHLEDISRADVDHVRAERPDSALRFVLDHVRDLMVRDCPGVEDVTQADVERRSF